MVTMGILPYEGKIPMVEPGIEPGTSWLALDYEAGREGKIFQDNYKPAGMLRNVKAVLYF
jgi:hypothetical protein